ncbi:DNA primase [Candidatus Kryptobacter tengchongensis]|uniref:DNA primase n=1 Tax=Kryptobacter tengchongensis TaxID=1643429 RepID=A0A916PI18_KRYT1|nr:DNA primase [Candidatus Kryptobacter tengchongensis]CUS98680.1 DNA primase [Candidatus Kryptobacter tengchongensis]
MRIPEDKIEEIRIAVDIVDYINQFVPLRKVGKNYVGLCPFHTEKTPSFTVSPDKQLYHCFGCGAGGNVFNFVMQYEKVSFFEAVKKIAEYVGVELPKPERKERWVETEFEELYEANQFAKEFFIRNLMKTTEGKKAIEYLYKRGINDATIRNFELGYSPEQWDALVQYAIKQNFSLESLEKAGVVARREDGTYYDRFRGRVIFPIFSITGRTIAFGGRRLKDDENVPKYINSPETKVYTKGKVLYGLYQGKEAIRRKGYAILVEGYMDCISLFQAGIENVVASGGTALTEEQVRLISNYTNTIYFLYDADSAGAKAMMRGIDLMLAQGLDVYIVKLPEGEDPDSFIKKNPISEFNKLIENAVNFVEFKALTYQQLGKFDDPNVKVKAIRSLVESISKIPDELKRNVFIREISSKYKIPERLLANEVESIILRARKESAKNEVKSQESFIFSKFKNIPAEERDLAKILLEANEVVLKFVFEYIKLSDITSDYVKLIYQKIHESFQENKGDYKKPDVNDLLNKAESDEFRSFLTNIALSKYEVSQFWNEKRSSGDEDEIEELWKAVDDVLTKFYLRKIQKIELDLTEKIKEAEKLGDEGRLLELLVKKSEIGKKKNILGIKGFKDIIRKYLNSLNKV